MNRTERVAPARGIAPAISRDLLSRAILRYGLVIVVAATVAFFALTEPAFRSLSNILFVLLAVSVVTIVALGVTVSLVVGGFDLSVGANAGLAVMISSITLVIYGQSAPVAVLAALALGAVVGLVNGFLIVKLRIPDLLATLGMLFVLQGLQLTLTGGQSVTTGMPLPDGETATGSFSDAFLALGRARLGPVPLPVILMAITATSLYIFLNRMRWGRAMYALGGNREAARLAGIPVDRFRFAAYVLSGVLASLGGIILAAQLGRGDVGAGNPFLLDAVGAALIGYAVLALNKPNVLGTVVGAIFLGVMLNGLTMKNAPYYTQDLVKGFVLMVALFLSFSLGKRQ